MLPAELIGYQWKFSGNLATEVADVFYSPPQKKQKSNRETTKPTKITTTTNPTITKTPTSPKDPFFTSANSFCLHSFSFLSPLFNDSNQRKWDVLGEDYPFRGSGVHVLPQHTWKGIWSWYFLNFSTSANNTQKAPIEKAKLDKDLKISVLTAHIWVFLCALVDYSWRNKWADSKLNFVWYCNLYDPEFLWALHIQIDSKSTDI